MTNLHANGPAGVMLGDVQASLLQVHMLPHLTPRALALLRCTSKLFCQLVDSSPVETLQPAMHSQLPPDLAAHANSSLVLQSMASSQAAVIQALQSGADDVELVHLALKHLEMSFCPRWAPEWPCKTMLFRCQDEDPAWVEDEDLGQHDKLVDLANPKVDLRQQVKSWLEQAGM